MSISEESCNELGDRVPQQLWGTYNVNTPTCWQECGGNHNKKQLHRRPSSPFWREIKGE